MEFIPGPNPMMVPTPAVGDSSHRPASTEFVTLAIAAIPSPPAGVSTTQVDFISGGVQNPLNQAYNIIEFAPFAMTLTNFVGKLSTGTLTAVLSIGATAITGGTLNLGTSQLSSTLSAINTAAIGSTIILTVSSVTSPANLSFMVQFTRNFTTG